MARIDEEARRFVREVDAGVAPALRRLIEDLSAALPRLVAEAERLAASVGDAETTPLGRAFAARRAQLLAAQVEAELRAALARLGSGIEAQRQAAAETALSHTERLAQAALPEGLAQRIQATGGPTWNRLPVEAVQHLAGAAGPGSPLGELLGALGADTGRRVRERLVTGLAAGKHPNAIARTLRDEAGLALSRAETIARTEVQRAYRAASLASYRANPGVVRAFRRVAGKDTRSCILCLALDGQEQPTGELLATHPRCRCAVVAVTRAWEELGFPSEVQKLADGAEASRPGQTQERGEAWFRRQGSETQRAMLGPGGFALYQQGARLRDFVAVQDSPDWGPTLRRKPLREVAAGLRPDGGRRDVRLVPGGYRALTEAERQAALDARSITAAEIDRALQAMSGPDPAGLLPPVTREQVETAAIFMNRPANWGTYWSPAWTMIEQGHPAGRSILAHELRELALLEELGAKKPYATPESEAAVARYWKAHARASYEEAEYCAAWARKEGQSIPVRALIEGHLIRAHPVDRERILTALRDYWRIDLAEVTAADVQRAQDFYRAKGLVP